MTDPVADSEDWEAESNPENNFSLCAFQIQSDRRPKTAFLRYVHVTHGTDAAIRVCDQLDSHKITEQNFQQFKPVAAGGGGRRGTCAPGGTVQGAAFGGAKCGNLKFGRF